MKAIPPGDQAGRWTECYRCGDLLGVRCTGAAPRRQDLVALVFSTSIIGVCGGTVRGLMLDAPVFWMADLGYTIIWAAMSVLFFLPPVRGLPKRMWLGLDADGLCVCAVVSAAKARDRPSDRGGRWAC
jgi:uncharacterized membrane protein YeiH